MSLYFLFFFFFFQAEDGIRDADVMEFRRVLFRSAFSRSISPVHKKLFDGIFNTLETGLSKMGESAASQTKAITQLIQLIKDIPMDGKQDYDEIGRASCRERV